MNPTPDLRIHDSMTGEKRPFVPLRPGHVGLYVCGVTVYDLSHIGHARVFVSFDMITRYLRHRGWDVTFVRNHTDVDDKIIKRANERGEDPIALAEHYIRELEVDLETLGCRAPTVEPRVSTHMAEIIALVEKLIERGHAYVVEGDVFYAVDSFEGYGKLSGQKLDEMRAGERVAVDARKRNPADFALWKSGKPGEPTWESPWGPGRPGWHIECSAMSHTHLGAHFDIHGGGKDLTFPHHENEIAQSEGAHGCTYVNTWMHVGLVNVDGEKMSKSLGNFWTIRDVLEHVHPEAVRHFMMTAQYRKPVNYSDRNLAQAQERVAYLYRTREQLNRTLARVGEGVAADDAELARLQGQLWKAMDDDFCTPQALAVLAEALRMANELVGTKKLGKKPDVVARLVALDRFLDEFAEIFGIGGGEPAAELPAIRTRMARRWEVDEAEVARLLGERDAARAAKDWAEADRIRDALLAMHVEVMDTPEGSDWLICPPAEAPADGESACGAAAGTEDAEKAAAGAEGAAAEPPRDA